MGDIHVGTVAERMEILMGEIRALGRLPRRRPGLGDEYYLAGRLHQARYGNLLSESQLAELAEFGVALAEFQRSVAANPGDTLMAEIRALGHVPRSTPGLGQENTLASRLRRAKRKGVLSDSQLAELAKLPSGAEVRASERKERERQVAELRGEIRQVKRKRAHSDSQFGEPAEFKRLAACGLPEVKRQRLLSDSASNFALRMRSRVLDDRTRKTLIEQFLDAKDLCQSLKTLFVITPESSFLTVPLDRDRSNLKLLQKSVGAEVVSFHPINGGNFDGWLLVINDYAEGTENRMITELVGSPFTIKGRAILAPPGVID